MKKAVTLTRRRLLASAACALPLELASAQTEWRPLFDGKTLDGWRAIHRLPVSRNPGGPSPAKDSPRYQKALRSRGDWRVVDGAITGGQEPPGSGVGGYLITDEKFDDFELSLEANPDWGVDTGIMIRATGLGSQGFQVLVDHREGGNIGSFYGNGIGGFNTRQFGFNAIKDTAGKVVAMTPVAYRDLNPPADPGKSEATWSAGPEAFFETWRFADWNEIRVRCEGRLPTLTSWINGEKMASADTATMKASGYGAEAVATLLGRAGHIALEVHNSGQGDRLGAERWLPGSVCRWRRIRVRQL
ncbi:MAG: DUF1080 domain-containing protein [Bryobacterales bacterium]|nr:DUF1080 domain-containing protein [Bryobacterales bacterium]MDE0621668.1 DUF1080 domain-containing protein [Bryobacterales bacterium]